MLELNDTDENPDLAVINEKKLFYKKLLIKSSIFCGILVVFFCLLLSFTLMGRKSWKNGLRNEIQTVFTENSFTEFSPGEYVRIKNNTTVSCGVYKAVSSEQKILSGKYAVIIRVPTIFGPVAAVYTFEKGKSNADFIGFAHIKAPFSDTVKNTSVNMQVGYWGGRIPAIVDSEIETVAKTKKSKGAKK